jgi:flagellar protein FlgJ
MRIDELRTTALAGNTENTVAPAAEQQADPAYVAKATKAAVEFERFFIGHMLRTMAGQRAFGIADAILRQLVPGAGSSKT